MAIQFYRVMVGLVVAFALQISDTALHYGSDHRLRRRRGLEKKEHNFTGRRDPVLRLLVLPSFHYGPAPSVGFMNKQGVETMEAKQ